MCQRFPERSVELDRCEANLVDIRNVYGSKFYDYHCQFAARAAIALRDNNIKIDWSVRDLGLLMMVVGNATANKCLTCSSTMHLSAFCPHVQQNIIPVIGQSVQSNPITRNHPINDKYGRPRTLVNNKEVCNNFKETDAKRQVVSSSTYVQHVMEMTMGHPCVRKAKEIPFKVRSD